MQTFLPFEDLAATARCLDRQRLGKQRVEAMQILKALSASGGGWSNHPAVKMWRGHELYLYRYIVFICAEWTQVRGYKDTCLSKSTLLIRDFPARLAPSIPPWMGDTNFHRSHQSNLLRKDEEHYRPFFPDVPNDLPYVWPEAS